MKCTTPMFTKNESAYIKLYQQKKKLLAEIDALERELSKVEPNKSNPLNQEKN